MQTQLYTKFIDIWLQPPR